MDPEIETFAEDRRSSLSEALEESRSNEASTSSTDTSSSSENTIQEEGTEEIKPLVAPAEYSEEDKQHFNSLDRKSQEINLRIHNNRQKWFTDTKKTFDKDFADIKPYKDIENDVSAYLKAMDGKGVDPRTAIFKAIQLYRTAEKDPSAFVEEFVKAKKLEGWTKAEATAAAEKIVSDPSLQARIDSLESKLTEKENAEKSVKDKQFEETYKAGWQATFETPEAKLKYPSLTDDEVGIRLASEIGSLTGGKTELSKAFLSKVISRNPKATLQDAFHEAYLFAGGAVSNSETPKVPDNKQNIDRIVRATGSQPGRSALSANAGQKTKLLPRKEALAAAAAELNSE